MADMLWQGYTHNDEFIVTQHPLVDTVSDFWNMIWDQNSIGIVLLSTIEDVVSVVPFYFGRVPRFDQIDPVVFFLSDCLALTGQVHLSKQQCCDQLQNNNNNCSPFNGSLSGTTGLPG